VYHAASAEVLASRNIFRAVFRSSRGNTCVREFGLAGASLYHAFGPFWDTWDTDSSPVCPWLNGETISSPVGAANFNNWVSLRRAYLDETFSSLTGGVTVNAYEDRIPLDEVFTLEGPCCVYLVQDLIAPVERAAYLVIGNNDSFALWFNGTLIDTVDECRFWMPFNHDYRVTLRSGVNRIVMKVLRRSRSFELSLGIKECGDRPSQNHHDWLVDLATRPPV
jgi:hypothetical protein